MIAVPEFDGTTVFFTAVGVFVIWSSWGKGQLSVKYLNARLAELGLSPNWLMIVEFVVTIFAGVVVSIAFIDPQTAPQAIAAGMGWTSLIARPTAAPSEEQHA